MSDYRQGKQGLKTKVIYFFTPILLTLGCWISATIFGGVLNPGTLIALAIVVVMIVFLLAPVTQRMSHKIWVFAGFLILALLFLPASTILKIFPIREGIPFDSGMAFTILLTISLALIITALLLNSVLKLYKKRQVIIKGGDEGLQDQSQKTGRALAGILVLSASLLAKALHSFYGFTVWDTTYDSLGWLWMPIPVMAVIFSSFWFFFVLLCRTKPAGFLYLLLIPALIAISARAQQVDFRQLTEERAKHVSQLIENHHDRVGRYPENLRELTPWYAFPLSGPVIIYGEDWCYDGSVDYYRLGYLYREHWSSPNLIG